MRNAETLDGEPLISRAELDSGEDLWYPESEHPNIDPNWHVMEYVDGGIRFINPTTEKSVWNYRDVVGFSDGNARVEAHYSFNLDVILLIAAKNVRTDILAEDLLDCSELSVDIGGLTEEERDVLLRISLSEWIQGTQDKEWPVTAQASDIPTLIDAFSDVNIDGAREKPYESRTLSEMVAVGINRAVNTSR